MMRQVWRSAMVSAEALFRWEHPERGLIMPDEFIDLFGVAGLIVPIGAWILEEACRQLVQWQERRDVGVDLVTFVRFEQVARTKLELDSPPYNYGTTDALGGHEARSHGSSGAMPTLSNITIVMKLSAL
jgi:EAL domain